MSDQAPVNAVGVEPFSAVPNGARSGFFATSAANAALLVGRLPKSLNCSACISSPVMMLTYARARSLFFEYEAIATLSPETMLCAAGAPAGRAVIPIGTEGSGAKAYLPFIGDDSRLGMLPGPESGRMAAF